MRTAISKEADADKLELQSLDLPSSDQQSLGRKSVRSGFVNIGSQAIAVLLQLISTVTLARLLTPQAYGLMGMVLVVVAFAALFKDLGLSAATIQRSKLTSAQVTVMFWVNVAVGALLTVLVAVASPLVVWFYNEPKLQWMTVALGGNIFLSSLGAQHAAVLTRKMCFNHLAISRLASAFSGLVISILAAVAGWEHWALVAGAIGTSAFQTTLLWCFSPWRPGLPKRNTGARAMVRYGLNLTGFELANFFSRNLDNILIGRVWGDTALGFYSRGYRLVLFPVSQVRLPLVSVAMPALSRLQREPERFRNYYRQLLLVLAISSMPISAFIVVVPEPVVLALFGEEWHSVAPIARWLAVAGFLQPVAGLFGSVLVAQGLARRHFRCGLISAIVFTVVFLCTVGFGVQVLAMGYALTGYMMFLPIFLYASSGTGIGLADFFCGVWRPACASVASAAVTLLLSSHLVGFSPVGELFLLVAVHFAATMVIFAVLPGSRRSIKPIIHQLRAAGLRL